MTSTSLALVRELVTSRSWCGAILLLWDAGWFLAKGKTVSTSPPLTLSELESEYGWADTNQKLQASTSSANTFRQET